MIVKLLSWRSHCKSSVSSSGECRQSVNRLGLSETAIRLLPSISSVATYCCYSAKNLMHRSAEDGRLSQLSLYRAVYRSGCCGLWSIWLASISTWDLSHCSQTCYCCDLQWSSMITRILKVIWEEPHRRPSQREWTRLLHVLLAVQCPL